MDPTATISERTDEVEATRRHLVIADRTLAGPSLREAIEQRCWAGPAQFHILVPRHRRSVLVNDPLIDADDPGREVRSIRVDEKAYDLAEARLASFMRVFGHLGRSLSGEIGDGRPLAAARRLLDRARFDEIILSTLAARRSGRLRRDLPERLERALGVPVVTVDPD